MLTLESNRLKVLVALPGEAPNTGHRFDRSGFVTDILLDGDLRFCASEPKNMPHPSSGGRGLCNEFLIDLSNTAKIGEYYPKFGVGLLRKESDQPMGLAHRYRDVIPFEHQIEHTKNRLTDRTLPMECSGYALLTEKTITVQGNQITMEIRAENHGEKPVALREYCHNFLTIDNLSLCQDYLLEMPQSKIPPAGIVPDKKGNPSAFFATAQGYTFCKTAPRPGGIWIQPDEEKNCGMFSWCLRHTSVKASIEGTAHFWPDKPCVWCCDHIISPELFYAKELFSGEVTTWKRSWQFGYESQK